MIFYDNSNEYNNKKIQKLKIIFYMISTIHSNHKFITSLDLNYLDIKFKSLKK